MPSELNNGNLIHIKKDSKSVLRISAEKFSPQISSSSLITIYVLILTNLDLSCFFSVYYYAFGTPFIISKIWYHVKPDALHGDMAVGGNSFQHDAKFTLPVQAFIFFNLALITYAQSDCANGSTLI